MSWPAPNFSQSGLYVERKHDEKNITRAVDKAVLTSASYCAINVSIGFSRPDLFNRCLLLQTPRVDMDSPLPSVLAVPLAPAAPPGYRLCQDLGCPPMVTSNTRWPGWGGQLLGGCGPAALEPKKKIVV